MGVHTRPGTGPLSFRGWRAFSWAFIPTCSKSGLKSAYNKPSTCGFAKSWGTFCGIKISTSFRRARRTACVLCGAT